MLKLLWICAWGLDFVGYVAHPKFNLPRKKTVQRMFAKLEKIHETDPEKLSGSVPSYLCYLKHVDSYGLSIRLKRMYYQTSQRYK